MSVKRIDHVLVDELGVDPLRDTMFDAIMSVETYSTFVVTKRFEFNPQAISDLQYGTVDLWPAILYYNKLADNWALVEGLEIRIPATNELTSALNVASRPATRTQRI